MATRGRLDRTRQFFNKAEAELYDSGVQLPPTYDANSLTGELLPERSTMTWPLATGSPMFSMLAD